MHKLLLFFFWYLHSGDTLDSANTQKTDHEVENSGWNALLHLLDQTPIHYEAIQMALSGYQRLMAKGEISDSARLIIADFSLGSHQERFFIINMKESALEHISLVSHGKNTGFLQAESFSNEVSSYKSSLGFYLTAETYYGRHGLSLRLDGLEKGFNDKARERAIVIHAADYVSCEFIEKHGRLGRSHGCPALPADNYEEVIHKIKQGSLLFIYGPEDEYRMKSQLARSKHNFALHYEKANPLAN